MSMCSGFGLKAKSCVSASRIIFGWQLVTFFLAGTMICSDLLVRSHTSVPGIQSLGSYFLLTFTFLLTDWFRRGMKMPSEPIWKFFLIALFDVEGNFCLIMAFRYTSITSISLLNCSTAIFVAILSWKFLKFKYRWYHLAFIFTTMAGLFLLVFTDIFFAGGTFTAGRKWEDLLLGDFLVVLGCFFYSLENVSQEKILKSSTGAVEYLAYFGLCAFFICFVQGLAVEWTALSLIFAQGRSWKAWLYLLLFTVFLFLVYALIPAMMRISSAISMNLSFLVVDFWALLAGHLLFEYSFHWLRYLAFIISITGVIGFNLCCMEEVMRWIENKFNFC